jgi:DNA-binding NtrC family response regulator
MLQSILTKSLKVKYEHITFVMKKTILIVEDDNDLSGIYKEILELHGFDIQIAINGLEGVEKFKEKKPSLVIMDADMPVLDGYKAFKQIKEIDNNAQVIIVTGFADNEPRSIEAIKQGLLKIISKPIGVNELLDLAKKYTNTN